MKLFGLILALLVVSGCATHKMAEPAPRADDRAGAIVANGWHVPGRALVCGSSALLAGAVLTITLGHEYEAASRLMHGGCAGPWTVTAQAVRNAAPER
jgi:hypothetical protein